MTRPDPPGSGQIRPFISPSTVSADDVLVRLRTAVWVYDFDAMRIIWANPEALALWDAESVDALAARDIGTEMSKSVKTRLNQHQEDFELFPDREISELWTLYPDDRPVRVQAVLRRHQIAPGRFGMLVEARREEITAPETIRSADALLHAQTIIALYDNLGRALYGNPAFRGTFGPGDRSFSREFVSPADLLDCFEGLRSVGEHRLTTQLRTRAGIRWFDIHAIRCKDAVTGDGAFHVNMLDVTEAREHQFELSTARDIAESAVKTRSQFLSVMSHELRTPLNGILGMANLLQSVCKDGEQKKMLEVVAQSGVRMLNLVESILRIVELESESVSVNDEEFDPILLLDSIVAEYSERAPSDVNLMCAPIFEERVLYRHDPDLIGQVIKVLVDNALKFTTKGFVLVRVGPGQKGGLVFEVADTGCGIPEENLEKIFDCFYQIDGSSTRSCGGTGVGLAIAKAIAGQCKGSLAVETELGRGSTFRFEVPATPVSKISAKSKDENPVEKYQGSHLRLVD